MNVRKYGDRTPGIAGPIYCDASFILDFFVHQQAPPRSLQPMLAARVKAAFDFYIWARGQKIEFVTSVLGVQECYHKVLFGPVRDAAKAQKWKDFRRAEPLKFAASIALGRAELVKFHAFFAGSGINLHPITTHSSSQTARLVSYARAILAGYEVDTMDAMHYAVMRRSRIQVAATSDSDWASLPYGTVVTLI